MLTHAIGRRVGLETVTEVNMGATVREFRRKDFGALSEIIEDVWQMRAYGDEIARPGSYLYALQCFSRSTFSRTAVVDGEVVGVVFAGVRGRSFRPLTSLRISLLDLRIRKLEGYGRLRDDFANLDSVDDDLISRYGEGFDSELILLILDERARGYGLGKRMFLEACDALRRQGSKRMFFYTDTDCNFGFYDALGAVRLGQRETECLGERLGMFIYGYDLSKQ